MDIETKYFGTVTVEKKDVVQVPNGLPGFREARSFVLLPLPDAPFYQVLQSLDEASLAFVVTNPYVFFNDYEFEIDESSKEELDLHQAEDVEVYTVLTVREPFHESTTNLQAPIVLNKKNKKAKQLILNKTSYTTKHRIISNEEAGVTNAHP